MPPMLTAQSFAGDGSSKDKRAQGWEPQIGECSDPVGSAGAGAGASLRPISSKFGSFAAEAGAAKLAIHLTVGYLILAG